MASYCPHCGAPTPDEARFCMKCGRERPRDTTVDAGPAELPAAELGVPTAADAAPAAAEGRAPEAPAPAEAPAEAPAGPGFTATSLPAPALPPAPVPASPASPPPPAHVPGMPAAPAGPSPLGAFFGRAFRGDWAGAAQAALWPLGLVLVAAVALAVPSYGQEDGDVFVGFSDRLRIALALLLQAVGGGFEVSASAGRQQPLFGSSGSGFAVDGSAGLHLIPLTVTALWIGALFVGVRILRGRLLARGAGYGGGTGGLEAAVRVTLLVAVGVLVLGLFAQPEIAVVEVSSSPVLAALGALVLALAVSTGVLHRYDLAPWLAQRPGWQALFHATGTALRALGVVLILCSVVAFISLTQIDDLAELTDLDDLDVSPLLVALLVLPNLGVAALGLGWGATLGASMEGNSSSYGTEYETASFGLSELGDITNSWMIAGALALGLLCALTLGILAARRCAHRGEQLLAAGVFFGLFLLLAWGGGVSVGMSAKASSDSSGSGSFGAGVSMPDALLFGLLWVFVAAFIAPYLLQMLGQRTGLVAAPVPPMPSGPAGALGPVGTVGPVAGAGAVSPVTYDPTPIPPYGQAATPAPAYDPHAFQLRQQPPGAPKSRRTALWVGTLAAAFLIGSGIAAGVLLWQDDGDGKADKAGGKDDKPAVSRSEDPSRSPSPSATPWEQPADPSESPDPADEDAQLPAGSDLVSDVSGFEFAVPDGWVRQGEDRPGQIVYAGGTGREEFLVGVVPNATYTSCENFTTIEKDAKKDPKKSDYQRLRLEPNTFQGRSGAIWEYTYTDTAGREIHALNQSYVADDGTEYAIQLSWRSDFWPAGEGAKVHGTALDHWRVNG